MNKELPDLIIFDLEATGRFAGEHEILEIGAIRVSPDLKTVRGEFDVKVKPAHIATAEPKALEVCGYTEADWKDAKPLESALTDFAAFCDGGLLSGYNVAFDWKFVNYEWRRLGIEPNIDYHSLDVFSLALAEQLKKGKLTGLRLTNVLAEYGIPARPEPHRALEDAKATLLLLQKLLRR